MARITGRMFGGAVRGLVVETLVVLGFVGFTAVISYIALRVL